ncbi:MAG TPA: DUF4261 domain-containing protein [Candidatus Angelobacter sp.]|nr:DUF4261 domain-containing protein [Candidatus Angelobacter sp.]
MSDEILKICAVELLYETSPRVLPDVLWDELRTRCGTVDKVDASENSCSFAFANFSTKFKGATLHPLIQLLHSSENRDGKDRAHLEEALQQSWMWPGAREAVAKCNTSLLLTDLIAGGLAPDTRLKLFHSALDSVLAVAPCQAIWWMTAQHVIDPVVYVDDRTSVDFHPIRFAVNVRLFKISDRPGEMIMDTLGLGTVGLPDLQCHFRGINPNEIARVLYNSANYIFANGDIVEDGNTIQGTTSDDKWKCHHEEALVKPNRIVIDINPGNPFAAGNR